MKKQLARRFGFTLTELLVLLPLLMILTGLLVPAVQKGREEAARLGCVNNLKMIGQAARSYAAVNDNYLPSNQTGAPWGSWNTVLLPYLDEKKLFEQLDLAADWWDATGSNNARVSQTRLNQYLCPAAPNPERVVLWQDAGGKKHGSAATDYVASAGAYLYNNQPTSLHRGTLRNDLRARLSDITDGTAQTFLVVEMADKPNVWHHGKLFADNRDRVATTLTFGNGQWAAPNWNHLRSHEADGSSPFGPCAVNCSNQAGIYGFHKGGANVVFCDGSVRFLKVGLNQELLIALTSLNGGEVLSDSDY